MAKKKKNSANNKNSGANNKQNPPAAKPQATPAPKAEGRESTSTPPSSKPADSLAPAPATSTSATAVLEGDGCGEDVCQGDVSIRQDGSADLRYDHGGIPWYLFAIYAGFVGFGAAYCSLYLLN